MMTQGAYYVPPSPTLAEDLFEDAGSADDDEYYEESYYQEGHEMDDISMGERTDDEGSSTFLFQSILAPLWRAADHPI